MRALRQDPLTGRWVVLVTDRALERRLPAPSTPASAECPFCPGLEHATAPTIEAEPAPPAPWSARAFANRLPALIVEAEDHALGGGLLRGWTGVGAHEVIVESPEHAPLHHQPRERQRAALRLAQRRLRDLAQDTRLAHIAWFRNVGAAAGASQPHPHSQVLATPIVPSGVARARHRAQAHLAATGRALLTEVMMEERAAARRVVWDSPAVTVLCPWAPQHPFEVWVVPEGAAAAFVEASGAALDAASDALGEVLRRLESLLGPVDHQVLLAGDRGQDGERWYLRVVPRLVVWAGLELGTGAVVHSVFPETAARSLRGVA